MSSGSRSAWSLTTRLDSRRCAADRSTSRTTRRPTDRCGQRCRPRRRVTRRRSAWVEIFDREGKLVRARRSACVGDRVRHRPQGLCRRGVRRLGSSSGGLITGTRRLVRRVAVRRAAFDPDRSRALLKRPVIRTVAMDLPSMPVIRASVEAIAQMLADVVSEPTSSLQNGQLGPKLARPGSRRLRPHRRVPPLEHLELFASPSGPYNPFHVPDSADRCSPDRAAAENPPQKTIRDHPRRHRRRHHDPGRVRARRGRVRPEVHGAFIPLGVRTTIPYGVTVDGS